MATLGLPEVVGADAETAGILGHKQGGKVTFLNLLDTGGDQRRERHVSEHEETQEDKYYGEMIAPLVWRLEDTWKPETCTVHSSSTAEKEPASIRKKKYGIHRGALQ